MNTTARPRVRNKRNVVWTGLLLGLIALIGGGSYVLETPPAIANCFDTKKTHEANCQDGCYTAGGNWGKEDCDWRPGFTYHSCLSSGDDCYSD